MTGVQTCALPIYNFEAQISLRDKVDREKYIGSDENWEKAENAIIEACRETGLKAVVEYGEAAFYGPKLNFMVKDALGRRWQLGTIHSLAVVARAVLARACAGLPAAASGAGEDAAEALHRAVDGVQDVVALLGEEEGRRWRECLLATLRVHALPGLLARRITSKIGRASCRERV